MKPDSIVSSVLDLLDRRGGTWKGTAGELLALTPKTGAPDATRLSKLIGEALPDLHAAGVTITRTRQRRTGRRLMELNRNTLPLADAPPFSGGVTLEFVPLRTGVKQQEDRPMTLGDVLGQAILAQMYARAREDD